MSIKGTKTFGLVDVKAGPDAGLPEGRVSALISVYGNCDSDGDVIDQGEYDQFVDDFKAGKLGVVPHVDHHQHDNPHAYTGTVVDFDAAATAVLEDGTKVEGLRAEIQFDLDQPDNETAQAYARKNYDNIRTGKVKEWSMAWTAKAREKLKDGTHLRGVYLKEVASVLIGANRMTRTLSVKADDPDAGTTFETLTDLIPENVDADTLETLGALDPEDRSALYVLLGTYADWVDAGLEGSDFVSSCPSATNGMTGMYSGEVQTKGVTYGTPVVVDPDVAATLRASDKVLPAGASTAV